MSVAGEWCFFKGQIMPFADAHVGLMTHALNYGTGCFEGIRAYWNDAHQELYVLKAEAHFERMHRSCRVLRIDLPYTPAELADITTELVRRNGYRQDVYIRPLAFKSQEVIGVRLHDLQDGFAIFTAPMGNYIPIEDGIKCGVSSWRRIDDNMIPPAAKVTGLYVNSALAKTEAIENGYDEAMGARPMARLIQSTIKTPLADEVLFGRLKNGGAVRVVVVGDDLGGKTLGFVYPEGPVLPRPERDIIEAGKKRSEIDETESKKDSDNDTTNHEEPLTEPES